MADLSTEIMDKVLGVDEESGEFLVIGNCDIVVHGLTSGSVKLQYKLSSTPNIPDSNFWDHPDGIFTTDVFTTIFVSSVGVQCRLVGASNNAGVYVRIARNLYK